MKRVLSFIIVFALLLGCLLPITASANVINFIIIEIYTGNDWNKNIFDTTINRILHRTLERADIPAMGSQSIRKTFSTRMMEQNTHDKIRASILGYSTPRVTNSNYSTVLTDVASKEMNRMSEQNKVKPKRKPNQSRDKQEYDMER